jgi:hypothetical protein
MCICVYVIYIHIYIHICKKNIQIIQIYTEKERSQQWGMVSGIEAYFSVFETDYRGVSFIWKIQVKWVTAYLDVDTYRLSSLAKYSRISTLTSVDRGLHLRNWFLSSISSAWLSLFGYSKIQTFQIFEAVRHWSVRMFHQWERNAGKEGEEWDIHAQ